MEILYSTILLCPYWDSISHCAVWKSQIFYFANYVFFFNARHIQLCKQRWSIYSPINCFLSLEDQEDIK